MQSNNPHVDDIKLLDQGAPAGRAEGQPAIKLERPNTTNTSIKITTRKRKIELPETHQDKLFQLSTELVNEANTNFFMEGKAEKKHELGQVTALYEARQDNLKALKKRRTGELKENWDTKTEIWRQAKNNKNEAKALYENRHSIIADEIKADKTRYESEKKQAEGEIQAKYQGYDYFKNIELKDVRFMNAEIAKPILNSDCAYCHNQIIAGEKAMMFMYCGHGQHANCYLRSHQAGHVNCLFKCIPDPNWESKFNAAASAHNATKMSRIFAEANKIAQEADELESQLQELRGWDSPTGASDDFEGLEVEDITNRSTSSSSSSAMTIG